MRSLVEVMKTSAEDLPQIYCDMDGVLCDFIKGANAAVNGLFVTADRVTRWEKVAERSNQENALATCKSLNKNRPY